MSIFPETKDLELRDGERVLAEWFGRHEQPHLLVARVMKPGKIVLTDQRLAFQPQTMGLAIQSLGVIAGAPVAEGDPWSTELGDVARVIDEGVSSYLTESARRLVVERRFGLETEQLLLMTGSDDAADRIRAAAAAVDPSAGAAREKWSLAANSVQSGTAVGGRLSLVGSSLVFLPSSVEKVFDALVGSPLQPILSLLGREVPTEAREIALADIAAVEIVEGELAWENVRSGGLRDRLRLRTKSGAEEIFVVGDVEKTVEKIRLCLPQA